MPSGGDWALSRSGSVHLDGVEDAVVADCLFTRQGSIALFVSNYARDVEITRNEFYLLIILAGDSKLRSPEPWDRRFDQDHVARVRISYNIFSDWGFFELQSAGVFHSIVKDITIENNVLFNAPRSG